MLMFLKYVCNHTNDLLAMLKGILLGFCKWLHLMAMSLTLLFPSRMQKLLLREGMAKAYK